MTTTMYCQYGDRREAFDGTEEGFIRAALKAGVKAHLRDGDWAYLEPQHDLISVWWNDWSKKYCASHVVSLEPLRMILAEVQR